MSRTRSRGKPPGTEFHGKRPCSWALGPGAKDKGIVLGIERARARQALHHEPREPEWDPAEYIPPEAFDSTVDFCGCPECNPPRGTAA